MDPPARFVHALRNPAVAAPSEGAHFQAAHQLGRFGSRCPGSVRPQLPPKMPVDFTGYWKMLANENFEEYLRALDVNVASHKTANLLKPDREIVQDGDHVIIRTLSTFRNYILDFQVGKEFEEELTGTDDLKCMTRVSWDGDKLECERKGEEEGRAAPGGHLLKPLLRAQPRERETPPGASAGTGATPAPGSACSRDRRASTCPAHCASVWNL
ncbi:LOW QUALITY PROTEIN: fatty acid-binding protein, liver-like [Artibeus jamaicensis]|uniref:LOW QUALITY PROTEIN: fatty acid-binding protein, liver-like n=1 Tax=Artibeus jamaicensis TaxID=9417 RepID=UPI00235AB90D|nr:LOW QUALITY PROTEIN: fatty acid-binding protein, liver-like [Artibeus jamaicensis]